MENTPKNQGDSSCLDISGFEGTSQSTPVTYVASRKRKFHSFGGPRKLTEALEQGPQEPQHRNDAIVLNLEKFDAENEQKVKVEVDDYLTESPRKRFVSAPNTPEKQLTCRKKEGSNSFLRNFSQINVHSQSPLNKESYNILYPELPPLEPQRKPLTPQKLRETVCRSINFKTSLTRRELFKKVFTNHVIMGRVFKELSSGDLYRLSQVSASIKEVILTDHDASERFNHFLKNYRILKENYRITPPSSPEKDQDFDVSPGSRHYYSFVDLARHLNKNQTLTKCPSCSKPSVVENAIAYCQSVNSCGYIYCQKCNSFAHNPTEFKDKCNRGLFSDLSNSNTSDYFSGNNSSFLSSNSLNLNTPVSQYSITFSETDTTVPSQRVKRNLSKTFNSSNEVSRAKILSSNNNRNVNASAPTKTSTRRRNSTVPILPSGGLQTPQKTHAEVLESSSPPRIKQYSACSKQSRRNLKRLTR